MTRHRLLMPVLIAAAFVLLLQPVPRAASPQASNVLPAAARRAGAADQTAPAAAAAPRPMELADILAWKSASQALLSPDGRWFACRLTPLVGDSQVLVVETQGKRMHRFNVGDTRTTPGTMAFSDDSRWLAFNAAPRRSETLQLKKQHKPIRNQVVILDLAAGKETRVDKIQRFAFSGERAAWIALKKYGADAPAAGTAPAARGASTAAAADQRPKGTDLVMRELATGSELNLGNVDEFAFDRSGRFLALTIDAADQFGNGIVLLDTTTGFVSPLDSARASYEKLAWTEKGDGLAALRGTEDKRYKDKVYSVVAFTGFGHGAPAKTVYDPADDKTFPDGMVISPNRTPAWTDDLSALLFGIDEPRKAEPKPDAKADGKAAPKSDAADAVPDDEKPDLVIWNYQDPRLPSEQQVQETRDRHFSYLCTYQVRDRKFIRLADEAVRTVTPAPKDRYALGIDVRAYELEGNLDGRDYRDVYVIDMRTGARTLALKKLRWLDGPSTDGTKFLYYDDGNYFVYDMAAGRSANVTKDVPISFVNTDDDHNVVNPPRPALGWTGDGGAVILSDGWDLWKVPAAGGQAVNLTVNGKRDGIRYRRLIRLDPEEKGWDLSVPRYVDMFGEYTKKGGIARIEPGKAGARPLAWEEASFTLAKAKKADVYLYTKATPATPPDYYLAGPDLEAGTKLTSLDEQVKPFAWSSGQMLVNYTVTLGKGGPTRKLQGSLFLPAGYVKGRTYPTVVYIYEKLSQGHYGFTTPTANGFNKSVYTSNGYAVLMPDISYRVNDPGMSAVWCLTAAVKAAIATGVVDPRHIGLQGHSWGGYQTAFAVTQTNLFVAAVAGAPLTDMISMYSLIYKNTGGANQPIFESSQGRFAGGYWDNWDAYVRNSPVVFAKNVRTPLVILHNDKDGAVDFTQGVEYFNTLRRLGKPVVMLEYPGENHGLARPANQQDYTVRMREFFDHFLKGKPAPDWWTKGVPRLEMDEYIKQQVEERKKAAGEAEKK